MESITDSSGDDASFLMDKNADILTLSVALDQSPKHIYSSVRRGSPCFGEKTDFEILLDSFSARDDIWHQFRAFC